MSGRYKMVSLLAGSNKRSRSGSILLPTHRYAKFWRSIPYYTALGGEYKGDCAQMIVKLLTKLDR